MIIQTGMRTDIPAFYSEWLINRIREGYVLVRNPYNPIQVTRYSLSPDVVDLIGFCTKNPSPMLSHMEILEPYGQYWFVTITPYGTDIEPNVPDKEKVMEDFKVLSRKLGAECVGWRYDPILLDENHTVELQAYGADCSGCMTVSTFENALHGHLNVPKRKTNQRNGECACLLGVDIGAYDTCGHLCKYCYANSDKEAVKQNMCIHDPKSPFLIGESQIADVIHDAKQSSWLDQQMSIFDFTGEDK